MLHPVSTIIISYPKAISGENHKLKQPSLTNPLRSTGGTRGTNACAVVQDWRKTGEIVSILDRFHTHLVDIEVASCDMNVLDCHKVNPELAELAYGRSKLVRSNSHVVYGHSVSLLVPVLWNRSGAGVIGGGVIGLQESGTLNAIFMESLIDDGVAGSDGLLLKIQVNPSSFVETGYIVGLLCFSTHNYLVWLHSVLQAA